MEAPRNTRSLLSLFDDVRADARAWFVDKPKAAYAAFHYKLHHLPQTNFDLGCHFAGLGRLQDAVFRFRIAIYLQPDYVRAHYNLGCCYLRQNKRILARQCFLRTLKLVPGHTEALFMLSGLDPDAVPPSQRPTRMPGGMVLEFFNTLATQYDAMEIANQYQGARVVADALKPLLAGRTALQIVDLGCGTGIAVRGVRAVVQHITGIDFSSAMAGAAREVVIGDKPLLDSVIEADITDMDAIAAPVRGADVLLCCNVLQFIGDLQAWVTGISAAMQSGATLLLTIEPLNTPQGYAVNLETGRFGHHPDYVKRLTSAAGLTLASEAKMQLYPNIPAYLMIFTKA